MVIKLNEVRCPKCYSENFIVPNDMRDASENEYYCFACDETFSLEKAYVTTQEFEIKI